MLLKKMKFEQNMPIDNFHVLFITNSAKQVAMNFQGNETVVWDYHVVLVEKTSNSYSVYDFNSDLEFPCQIDRYMDFSFPPQFPIHYKP